MKSFVLVSRTVAGVVAGVFMWAGCAHEPAASHTSVASPPDTPGNYCFAVTGMSCEGCAGGLRSELLRTPGVKTAEVNFRTGTACVTGDPQQLSATNVIRVIEESGFAVKPNRP